MTMVRCNQGHYYDSREASCPFCSSGHEGATIPAGQAKGPAWGQDGTTAALGGGWPQVGETQPVQQQYGRNQQGFPPAGQPTDEGVTIGIMKKKLSIDPVVGWLVCVEGSQRGRDYKLFSGKNSIGRSERMKVVLQGDDGVSRENHAFIVHDPRKNTFRIQAGESRELVYMNDNEVEVSCELKPYDVIELGSTKLVFIPLCGEKFKWD